MSDAEILQTNLKIIISNDGSPTLYNELLKETYHSLNGAIVEALHVYIDAGLKEVMKTQKHITILEIGLGTGLNALLTCTAVLNKNTQIDYHVLEPFPVPPNIITQLNYPDLINVDCADQFKLIHQYQWEETITLSSNMSFKKYKTTLENFESATKFDLIYFDAFAPSKQPEIWAMENLKKIYDLMKPEGIFITYCSSGALKRNIKELGFEMETLKGPPGKMEMTRAIKKD